MLRLPTRAPAANLKKKEMNNFYKTAKQRNEQKRQPFFSKRFILPPPSDHFFEVHERDEKPTIWFKNKKGTHFMSFYFRSELADFIAALNSEALQAWDQCEAEIAKHCGQNEDDTNTDVVVCKPSNFRIREERAEMWAEGGEGEGERPRKISKPVSIPKRVAPRQNCRKQEVSSGEETVEIEQGPEEEEEEELIFV